MWEFWDAGRYRNTGRLERKWSADDQRAQTLTDVTGADVTARSGGKWRPVAESRPKVRLGVRSGPTGGGGDQSHLRGKFKPEIDSRTKRKGEKKKGERRRLAGGLAARRVCARPRQRAPVTSTELGSANQKAASGTRSPAQS